MTSEPFYPPTTATYTREDMLEEARRFIEEEYGPIEVLPEEEKNLSFRDLGLLHYFISAYFPLRGD